MMVLGEKEMEGVIDHAIQGPEPVCFGVFRL
jgi:hypothetical protein